MEQVKEKYMMINIKIPIVERENEQYDAIVDLLDMEVEEIDSLPEENIDPLLKEELKTNLYMIFQKIFSTHEPPVEEQVIEPNEEPVIKPNQEHMEEPAVETNKELDMKIQCEEIKKMKKPKNATFKLYKWRTCKKYTLKNYDNNGL